jgi:hypothetical protein
MPLLITGVMSRKEIGWLEFKKTYIWGIAAGFGGNFTR